MEKLLAVLLLFGLLSWLTCHSNKPNGTTPGEETPPDGTEEGDRWNPNLHDIWVLTNLNGEDLAIDTPRPQLELFPEEGRIQGQGSCNRLFGKMKAGQQEISFTEVGTTKMHCGEYMERESRFLQELNRAERYLVRNGELFIFWGDLVTLTFRKVD